MKPKEPGVTILSELLFLHFKFIDTIMQTLPEEKENLTPNL